MASYTLGTVFADGTIQNSMREGRMKNCWRNVCNQEESLVLEHLGPAWSARTGPSACVTGQQKEKEMDEPQQVTWPKGLGWLIYTQPQGMREFQRRPQQHLFPGAQWTSAPPCSSLSSCCQQNPCSPHSGREKGYWSKGQREHIFATI